MRGHHVRVLAAAMVLGSDGGGSRSFAVQKYVYFYIHRLKYVLCQCYHLSHGLGCSKTHSANARENASLNGDSLNRFFEDHEIVASLLVSLSFVRSTDDNGRIKSPVGPAAKS